LIFRKENRLFQQYRKIPDDKKDYSD